ncbi:MULTISPECIES: iron ABC transporter substrate-binding protein [Cryobacterium]|uniref:Iron ABC transporter substrate-binding protein n=1 Tax=Cryobacterium breve TaxID=1259258 RepID=A0ABY2J4A1_9MICO|nr:MULTISPECIES: iron ABC transporter substrate-binding protein [Cryobacterium]TFC92103.1 iron ABC transporter substrate-binding protein [Cryobacterium sp. TmT3-12]TFC99757.1 iron ABC transporter substrate-binding protein [Cryobacterium breve]
MILTRRWALLTAIGTVTLLGATGCSAADESATSTSATPSGSITVYNAQHEELTQAWADEFTAETGVTVTLRNGSDSELGNQLVQEGTASKADVFLTENSPAMSLVEQADLLAPVDDATLEKVPEQYRPSTGLWTGIAARSTVFAYNPSLISESELPASLLDLADPAWAGRWAASPSGADFQAIVSALLELEGEDATRDWLAAMKQNAVVYKGNSTVMKAVNAGEIPAGVIYHYYWFGDQAGTGENSSSTEMYYFKNQDPGAFVSVSGGGVLETSENPVAAQAFLAFITGKGGQEILQTGTSFEYPVSGSVDANPALVPLSELDAPVIDPSKLNSTTVTDLMTEAGFL